MATKKNPNMPIFWTWTLSEDACAEGETFEIFLSRENALRDAEDSVGDDKVLLLKCQFEMAGKYKLKFVEEN